MSGILLVKYHENMNQQPLPRRANDRLGIFPPLGLAYLAGVLRKEGYEVQILDIHALNLEVSRVGQEIRKREPDLIGITAKTLGWPAVIEVASRAKSACPEVPLVVGGPHLSIYPEESLSFPFFDIAVIGDGEETFLDIVRALYEGERDDIYRVPGTFSKRGGEILKNPLRPAIRDLDSLPFPSLELLPMDRYHCLTVHRPFTTLISTRGCPYKCGFCSQIYCGERFRMRSPESVADEMEWHIKRFRAKEIVMFDETFTIGKQRVLKICDLLSKRGLKFRWNVRTRVDTVDRDILEALKRAGCKSLHMGIESGCPVILEKMKKGVTLDEVYDAFAEARRVGGFELRGYFMLGYLDETPETLKETIRLSRELDLDWASFSIVTPLPATDLFHEALQRGYIKGDLWKEYTLKGGGEVPYLETEVFTLKELKRAQARAYAGFYLRPRILMKKLKSIDSITELLQMVSGTRVLYSFLKPGRREN